MTPPKKLPNLAGIISKSDLAKNKKSGKFDYVPWAGERKLLMEHAPGWQYELSLCDGSAVWPAPNGSGYLMGHFRHDDGTVTTDFPYAITDFKNAAIQHDRITCADVANSHRRSMCACAAFTFCLAYEMWADEEIMDTARENAGPSTPTPPKPAPEPPEPVCPMPKSTSASEAGSSIKDALTEEERKALTSAISGLSEEKRALVLGDFRTDLGLHGNSKVADHIKDKSHAQVLLDSMRTHQALWGDPFRKINDLIFPVNA